MGVVLMSKRELNRIDLLARLDGRRLTASAAADLMRVTVRQTHRLLKRYRYGGAPATANRRRFSALPHALLFFEAATVGQVSFDPKTFLPIALEESESEGSA